MESTHPGQQNTHLIRRVIDAPAYSRYEQTRLICAQDVRSTKIINVSHGLNMSLKHL